MEYKQLLELGKQLFTTKGGYTFEEIYPHFKQMFGVGDEYKDDLFIIFNLTDDAKWYGNRKTDDNGCLEKAEFTHLIKTIPKNCHNVNEKLAIAIFRLIDDLELTTISIKEFTRFFNIVKTVEKHENENENRHWIMKLIEYDENTITDIYKIISNGKQDKLAEKQFVQWYLSFC